MVRRDILNKMKVVFVLEGRFFVSSAADIQISQVRKSLAYRFVDLYTKLEGGSVILRTRRPIRLPTDSVIVRVRRWGRGIRAT